MSRPSFAEICMGVAESISQRSTCLRTNSSGYLMKVGCVIASRDFRKILAWGYNGNAAGLPNECDSKEPGACGCFPSGTAIDASLVQRAYRRWYKGPLIRVTAGDQQFSTTPNHPVLALGRGWVAAETLAEGDYLVGTSRTEGVAPNTPDDQHNVLVEQAFQSLSEASDSHVRHTGARHHFHGDGALNEDVDVVTVDSSLATHLETTAIESFGKPLLPRTLEIRSPLPSQRTLAKGLLTLALCEPLAATRQRPFEQPHIGEASLHWRAANTEGISDVSGRLPLTVPPSDLHLRKNQHALPFVLAETLGSGAKNSSLSETVLDGSVRDTLLQSDLYNSLSGKVRFHKVSRIERYFWSGHVFNLQTASGWFTLQHGGIIVKNCIHAEANAVVNCDSPRATEKLVFCTHLPCVNCGKLLINLGNVLQVTYKHDYRIRTALELFDKVGIKHRQA